MPSAVPGAGLSLTEIAAEQTALAGAPELCGDERGQVPGLAQVGEVGLGVGVRGVGVGGALVDAGEQVGVQEAHRGPLSGRTEARPGPRAVGVPRRAAARGPVTQGDLTVAPRVCGGEM